MNGDNVILKEYQSVNFSSVCISECYCFGFIQALVFNNNKNEKSLMWSLTKTSIIIQQFCPLKDLCEI